MCTASGCLYILVRGKRDRRETPSQGDVQLPCVFHIMVTPQKGVLVTDVF